MDRKLRFEREKGENEIIEKNWERKSHVSNNGLS